MSTTHEVFNQAPARVDVNEYTSHTALVEAVNVYGGGWATDALTEAGALVGRADFQRDAELANTILPKHHSHDRWGNRIDDIEFHPAYHRLMQIGIEHGVSNFDYRHADTPGAGVACQASTGMSPCASGVTPTLSRPMSPVLGRRPVANSTWS